MSRSATIKNCYGVATAASGASTSMIWTFRKNGATCTSGPVLTFANTTSVQSDTTDSCAVAAGDLVTWESTITGSPGWY